MRAKRVLLTAVLALMCAAGAEAQNIAAFKERLTGTEGFAEGRVTIDEHGSAMQAVDSYAMRSAESKGEVAGYRVSIYSGKSQNSRTEAVEAQRQFSSMFPSVPTHLVYSEPYFTLSVGNCRDKEEALVLWGRVKNVFTKAFIMNAMIPMEAFLAADVDYTAVVVEEAEGAGAEPEIHE